MLLLYLCGVLLLLLFWNLLLRCSGGGCTRDELPVWFRAYLMGCAGGGMTVVLGAGVAAAATYGVLGWLVFIIDAISLGNSSICSVFILSDAFRLVSLLGIAIWRTSIIRDFVRLLYVSADLISSCITSNCEFDCLAQRLIMLIKWFMKSLIAGSEKEVGRSMQISVNNRSASDSAEENDAKSRAFKCAHVLIESGAPSNRPIMDDKGPRRSRWAMAVFKHSLWNVSPCGVFMALTPSAQVVHVYDFGPLGDYTTRTRVRYMYIYIYTYIDSFFFFVFLFFYSA